MLVFVYALKSRGYTFGEVVDIVDTMQAYWLKHECSWAKFFEKAVVDGDFSEIGGVPDKTKELITSAVNGLRPWEQERSLSITNTEFLIFARDLDKLRQLYDMAEH